MNKNDKAINMSNTLEIEKEKKLIQMLKLISFIKLIPAVNYFVFSFQKSLL